MGITVTPSAQRVSAEALGKHLQENPGTAALRNLRSDLVAEGIPLDKLTPSNVGGTHDRWVNAKDPEQKLKEYMRWVASSTQYSPSTAPQFLAQATMSWLRSAQNADGTLDRATIASRLGPRAVAVFDALVREIPTGTASSSMTPPPKVSTTTPPANMLGVKARSPDRGHLFLEPDVVRRLPFRMMVADLRMVGQLERKLSERTQRRDPARRIMEHVGTGGVESPTIAALDALTKQHAPAQPFAGKKILVLQHLYASTQSILDACVSCGAAPADITVMGKPYSGSMQVAASMVERGFQLVTPSLHQSEFSDHEGHMDALVEQQVGRLLAESGPDDVLLVLDDGGHVAKVVHESFNDDAHRFRFVEQTQRGATAVKAIAQHVPGGLKAPVVNVAESRAKKDHESPSIGYSVWKETKVIIDKLETQGVSLPKSATVLGCGAVGAQVAGELQRAGYDVHVYDPDPKRQQSAMAAGFTVHADKLTALSKANVLVSATGRTAVNLDEMKALPKQAMLVNAASANNELNATNVLALQMLSANALMG
ncbi:MAG TPA: NAD(P)-dependent oxidoreductase, partial [Myxococcota bacterium]